jgi:hypothetical protein
MAANEHRDYPDPIFKIAGKDSFLEVYDGLSMSQPKMNIKLTTYTKGQKGSAKHVNFYLSPNTFLGFCDAIITGQINNFIPSPNSGTDNPLFKTFPAVQFGIPLSGDRMRRWTMRLTERGYYGVSILEKERRDQWDAQAPELGHITFNVPPFQLLAMASSAKSYLERKLMRMELQDSPSTLADEDELPPPDAELGIE